MGKRLVILALAFGLVACAGGPDLPPKSGPEEVELIDPRLGQQPDEGYKTIGPIEVSAPLGTPQSELTTMLRARAAELGADAVIFKSIRQNTEGEIRVTAGEEEELIATGTAIYWPRPAADTTSMGGASGGALR